MAHSARAIANYLLERAWQDGRKLDPMQIQKLAYIAHGWFLARHDEPLVKSDFQAWQYGPVQPELYSAFKRYGAGAILELASHGFHTPTLPRSATREIKTLDDVWATYGHLSGVRLSQMTHEQDTPWATTWRMAPSSNRSISNSLIAEYYRQHPDFRAHS